MKRLSRFDIEAIAEKIVNKYKSLPEISGTTLYRIDPELLLTKVLGLNIEYAHLSFDGSVLGLTSFGEVDVEIYDDADESSFLCLDGKTVVVEKDLVEDSRQRGRCNFTIMHEGSHQIFKMLFPKEYAGVENHYYTPHAERKKPITDWEEWQANELAAAILLPKELILQGMHLFNLGTKITCLSKLFNQDVFERFSALADFLGSSKTALAIRMKHLNLLDKEYLENPYDMLDDEAMWEVSW